MARKKSRIVTLKNHNKKCRAKHNCPEELNLVAEKIEGLDFVTQPLGKSKWGPKSAVYSNEIKITGFNDLTKSICANIYGKFFQQKVYIRVDFPNDDNLLEKKCLEKGIEILERKENSYYYDKLREFYESEIIRVAEEFYNN